MFSDIPEKVRQNYAILILFILVIFIFGSFHIINIAEHGYRLYNPVPVVNGYTSNLDEAHYLPGFREVMDGRLIVKSPQLFEYKDGVNQIDLIPYLFLGSIAGLLHAGVNDIFIASDFIFPAIGFLCLYLLMRTVFAIRKDLSLLFSLLMTIFQVFTWFIVGLFNLSSFNFTKAVEMLGQAKLYAPEFVFIPFVLAIISLYFAFKKDSWLWSSATIAFGVVLVYSYVFYSTFFWTTFLLFALYNMYINKSRLKCLKKIVFIALPSILLSVPWILEFLAYRKLPAYADILMRVGVESGRFIHVPLLWAAVSIVFLFVAYKVMHKKDSYLFWFASIMLLSTIIWSNLQVVIGYNIQPFHWIYRISEVIYFILAAYILQYGYEYLRAVSIDIQSMPTKIVRIIFSFFNHRYVVAALIVVFAVYGLGYNITAASVSKDIYTFNENELQLYEWLNSNTPKDTAILTLSIDQNIKIPAYTHNNIYLPNGFFSTWQTAEIENRIAFLYDVYGLPEIVLEERLNHTNDAYRKEYLDELYEGKRFSLPEFEKYFFVYYPFGMQFFYGHWDYQEHNPDNASWIGYWFPSAFRQQLMSKMINNNYTIYHYDYMLLGPYERQLNASVSSQWLELYSNKDFMLFEKVE